MPVKANKKQIPDSSTQRYLPFSQIRDNIVIISREKFIIGQKVSYIKLDDRIYYAKGVN